MVVGVQTAHAEPIIGLTVANSLVTFDSATPGTATAPVPVTGLGGGETLHAIDRRPANGFLYGLGSLNNLYTVNATTGAATLIGGGGFSLNGISFGFDFNPVVDRIRVTSHLDQNLRLNPNDGTLTATDTLLAYAAGDPNAGVNPNVVGSAYTNSFAPSPRMTPGTTLYDIDSNLDILAIQNPPNNGTLNTVGALGIDLISELLGFDISGVTGTGFLANGSSFYTVNLATGAATLVGNTAAPLIGIAAQTGVAAVPEPSSLTALFAGLGTLFFGVRRKTGACARRAAS
jgi:hypothetical protein